MTTTTPGSLPSAFELSAGRFGRTELTVLGFTAEEGISKLFKFDIEVAAPPDIDLGSEREFVGTRSSFTIRNGEQLRVVHGVVARVTSLDGSIAGNRRVFRVRVVPPIWISKHKFGSRVYQDHTVQGVVEQTYEQVAADNVAHQECDFLLSQPYEQRAYCVQYKESDYDFTKRIVAEEGLFWYFRHSTDQDATTENVMVFADRASAYASFDDPLPSVTISARAFDTRAASSSVTRFESAHTLRTNSVLLRDYDDTRPLLQVQGASGFDAQEYARALEPEAELRVYEHRGDFLVPDADNARAEVQLEQHRRRSFEATGESVSRLLIPGYRFNLEAADAPSFSGEYVITYIRHDARLPEYDQSGRAEVYTNTFRCVRSDLTFRPKRPKSKPRQVLESAIVTGPQDGTVHTDEYGRVRVQFLWDTTGAMDETSTTWLRVVQGWAGASYGFQFIPRVGMEVMVSFLGGDPDSPVVVGAIHDGARPFPFRLPDQKTRSGLRTESTPGGQGFNELSFEDLAGSEQVYLHAQRDLDADINRNQNTTVKKSQITDIGEAQTLRVGGDQEEIVEGAVTRAVHKDERGEVKGNRTTGIGGSDILEIEYERRLRVGTNERREVVGESSWKIGDDLTIRTEGSYTTLVGKADAKRSYVLHVEGTTELSSEEVTEIVSQKAIRLRCGDSILELNKDNIEIISPKITLRTPDSRVVLDHDKLEQYAKKDIVLKSGDTVLIASVGASLSLKTEVKASGSKILLNSPDIAKDPEREEPLPPTVIEIVDDDGRAIPYGRFVLVLGDGAERSFVTDENGRIEVPDLEGSAHIRLPGLTDSSYG